MTVFILSPEDEARIVDAAAKAKANPIARALVEEIAGQAHEGSDGVLRGDRPQGLPEPQEVELPLGWRLNVSCEEQPFGAALHLSLSSPRSMSRVPRREAMDMINDVLMAGPPLAIWIEEFKERRKEAGVALNWLVRA